MGKCRLLFEKTGRARYISHLDLMRTLRRVFARAGVALRHTEGFNPHPYISLALPLPVGHESVCELMDFETAEDGGPEAEDGGPEAIAELLNPKMPEGVRARTAYIPARPFREIKWAEIRAELEYGANSPRNAESALAEYFAADSIIVPKRTKRGIRDIDIAPAIRSARFTGRGPGRVDVEAVLSVGEPVLNPELLLTAISRDKPALAPDCALIRRAEIFDADMNIFR